MEGWVFLFTNKNFFVYSYNSSDTVYELLFLNTPMKSAIHSEYWLDVLQFNSILTLTV
jgi:hypothetical protein